MIGDVVYKIESINLEDPSTTLIAVMDPDNKLEIRGVECKIGRLQDNDIVITQADNVADHHGTFKFKKDEGYEYYDNAREGQ